ncbi:MAG: 2'-5' RNA ligase family protein [Flavobacterium sp.]|nr:2'-5' RNA ligase family protein [Flavobacterium sp.]
MPSIPLFSIVIFPNEDQIQQVKKFKQLLKSKIGWFGSTNAAAHITVINFENELTLALYIEQIREYCKTVTPQNVIFNSWGTFGEKTFFISPDEKSKLYLNSLISQLHSFIGFKTNNINAHLTIARGLDAEKMTTAKTIFSNTEVNLEFICDAIYIRKFNNKTQQYTDIVEKIHFEC